MSRDSLIAQSHIAELTDDKLLDLIAFLYENIKSTEERMKSDEHIIRVEEELKAYKSENYTDQQKAWKAQLKASRSLAKARDLKFDTPEVTR